MFKQGQESVRCGSQCWYSPQGWSHRDEKETPVLHNEAAPPVGKSRSATFNMVVNFRLGFTLCYIPLTWHWAAKRPLSVCTFTHCRQSSNQTTCRSPRLPLTHISQDPIGLFTTAKCGLVRCLWYSIALALLHVCVCVCCLLERMIFS